MTNPAPFKLLSLQELIDLNVPDLEYAVDGILPLGSLTLLAAREKAGKSMLLADLLCSIALGEPFLDRPVRQGPAILVPAEENIRDIRQRIITRLDGRTDAPIYVLPVSGFTDDRLRLSDPVAMARLLATVRSVEPVAVGLDPMRELHDLPENESDYMGPLLRPLRQIGHDTNTALVLNHHMNRNGTARGSTGIKAAVDQEWAFQRTDEEGESSGIVPARGVITIDGRFGPKQRLGVRLGPNVRWQPSEAQVDVDAGGLRGRILACLAPDGDGLDADGIADALKANRKTVQNTLSTMLKEKPAPIVGIGLGTKNAARRYILAADGSQHGSHDSQRDGSHFGSHQLTINDSSQPKGGGLGIGNHFGGNGIHSGDELLAPGDTRVSNSSAWPLANGHAPACIECGGPLEPGRRYACKACEARTIGRAV